MTELPALPSLLFAILTNPIFIVCLLFDILILVRLLLNPPDSKAIRAHLYQRPWSVREMGIIILLLIATFSLGRVILTGAFYLGIIIEAQLPALQLVEQTFVFHLPVLLMIFCLSRTITPGGRRFFGSSLSHLAGDIGKGCLICMGAIPLVAITDAIATCFLSGAGYPQEPQYAISLLSGDNPMWLKNYVLVTGILVAPVVEELLFRGIALTAISKQIGIVGGTLLVSVLFACIHLNLYALAPLFVLALILATSYTLTGSLTVPMTIHMAYNSISICLVLASNYVS